MEETVSHQRIDLDHMREELDSLRSRRTATGSTLDACLVVTDNKLVISCKTRIQNRVIIRGDLNIDKGNIYLTSGAKEIFTLNGKYNLVVGVKKINQEGSHNVVIGDAHTLASYGGLIAGYNNTVSVRFSNRRE